MIANMLCSFWGTVAFSILFNVHKRFYFCCGLTGMAGWLCYCALAPLGSAPMACFAGTIVVVFAVADFRCVEEMSDHGIFSIRDIPACAGSRCLLYGVLFCYRQSEACISERNRVIEDGVCHRAWNCICGINSKTMVSSKLLEE